jgi:hypothetical protein
MGKKVIVTTVHRGVFFGELIGSTETKTVTLRNARMGIYWATSKGLFELADVGPNAKSKIGSVAPEVTLHDVTSVVVCSEAAIAKWESA